MASFVVETPRERYAAMVERGLLERIADFLPAGTGTIFVVSTEDVWRLHGDRLRAGLAGRSHHVLFFPGGEDRKRLAEVEALAEQMMELGGDRASVVVAFGGGVLTDVSGFLAAVFMRGVPVIQVPTTLLAQVDAAVGGKTGVNLRAGKNLIGSFHQPLAVLIDPSVLRTLPEREYRAGLYEVLKHGVIRSRPLFDLFRLRPDDVLGQEPDVVDEMIRESVRIKAEVVSLDERESDLRRILNFGHTVGHALEAETGYTRFLHGEAVAFGMRAAVHLARHTAHLSERDATVIVQAIQRLGPIPSVAGISAENLLGRLAKDKKAVRGTVHWVLPEAVGSVRVVSGIPDDVVLYAIKWTLQEPA